MTDRSMLFLSEIRRGNALAKHLLFLPIKYPNEEEGEGLSKRLTGHEGLGLVHIMPDAF